MCLIAKSVDQIVSSRLLTVCNISVFKSSESSSQHCLGRSTSITFLHSFWISLNWSLFCISNTLYLSAMANSFINFFNPCLLTHPVSCSTSVIKLLTSLVSVAGLNGFQINIKPKESSPRKQGE